MKSIESASLKQSEKPRVFYGWSMVGIGFTSLLIRFGVLQTFGIFMVALINDFHWSVGAVSGAQSLVMVMIGVGGPLVGWCIQKWGARKVIAVSALFLGFFLALTSQVKQIWQFYLLWGFLVGLAHSFQSIVPWTTVLSNWFIKKRGAAMGIAMSGIGIGYFIIVPVTQYIISRFGWQIALISVGAILALGIAPLSAIFVREKPEDMNLLPDGDTFLKKKVQEKQDQSVVAVTDGGWTLKKAMKTPAFWFICLSFATILFTTNLILAHQVFFMVKIGYKTSFAAFIFGVFGLTSLPFRVVWGFFSDRLGPILTYTLSTVLLLAGIAALLTIKSPSQSVQPYIFALLWGCSYGTTIIIVAVVSANLYQGKSFGVIFGFIMLVGQILGSPGAWLGGYLFDLYGNYNMAFTLAIISAAVSCALMWAVNIQKKNETTAFAEA